MKIARFLGVGLSGMGLFVLTDIVNYPAVLAAEEKVVSHERVTEPTQVLMNDIANRINNILDGILAGNFKYVAQESGSIVDQSYKINDAFFPVDPKENKWFKRAKIDPGDSERITKLKEEFNAYLKGIASSALEIQKAANTNNPEATFRALTSMIERTCFECHKEIRDRQVPVENR